VLLIDTLRADRLGALGGERDLSPALDKLADESLVFTESWSTCSWTLPSVATIFTSNHAEQHRARTKAQRVSADVDTLAGVLRDAGYRTAAFTDGGMVHHSFGLERGFMLWNTMGGPLPVILSRARQFLETAGDGPYFLFVHSYEVHSPYDPPEEARAAVVARHGDLLGGRAADPLQVEDLITRRDGTWRVPPDLAAMLEALYDEEVRFTDREVGEWLDELRGSGVLDRALFVVTSDHGEEFGEHGLLGHSDTLYREQLHVPLLLRFPAGSPLAAHNGRRDGDPISHLDLAPTLVDALGLGDRLLGTTFDGVSVFASSRRSPIWATRFHDATGLLTALRDRRHVWIDGTYRAPRGAPGPELYDLASDPRELENLRQAAPEEAARLAEIRRALLERYGARHKVDTRAEVDAELEQRLQHLGY
jgi:arylsulfatase A-like enzyme